MPDLNRPAAIEMDFPVTKSPSDGEIFNLEGLNKREVEEEAKGNGKCEGVKA